VAKMQESTGVKYEATPSSVSDPLTEP
jgi:hypothetical protein